VDKYAAPLLALYCAFDWSGTDKPVEKKN